MGILRQAHSYFYSGAFPKILGCISCEGGGASGLLDGPRHSRDQLAHFEGHPPCIPIRLGCAYQGSEGVHGMLRSCVFDTTAIVEDEPVVEHQLNKDEPAVEHCSGNSVIVAVAQCMRVYTPTVLAFRAPESARAWAAENSVNSWAVATVEGGKGLGLHAGPRS